MLLPRIASAIVLGPLFLLLVYVGFPWFDVLVAAIAAIMAALVAAIAAIMAAEFARMDGKRGAKRRYLISVACVIAVVAISAHGGRAALGAVLIFTLGVIGADYAAGRRGFSLVHTAVPYVALPALALVFLRAQDTVEGHPGLTVFWLLAVVWGTDIGAYAFGRLIGGPKLAPAISPKKTWSGAVGGLACGVGASALLLWGLSVPVGAAVLGVAVVASVASQIGDLLESGLKRWYEVKDSGTLIPGHGGLMDRFDGLWAAAPVAALFCGIFGGGVNRW